MLVVMGGDLPTCDEGDELKGTRTARHMIRFVSSLCVGCGFVFLMLIDKRVLHAARRAVVAADTPLLRPARSSNRIAESVHTIQASITRVAVFGFVAWTFIAVAEALVLYTKIRILLFPAAVTLHTFFLYYVWDKVQLDSSDSSGENDDDDDYDDEGLDQRRFYSSYQQQRLPPPRDVSSSSRIFRYSRSYDT
eukprot:CAMPEP_0170186164 /NCGR_PEP_ID=MMETSP0040_2-20121228/38427_1 /TAXON_ID=641309 /ORGANISM="Lotharella oceanica, Strain CCMP622" /LENGTH=192 /DNA_ID=CAMNT_0010432809 /DNA_START=236 /DNA_END=814 /DNA_ORIENTATION=-